MFTVTVKSAARARGVSNYYQLGLKLGGGPKFEMMAKRLWGGQHIPTLPTLFQVCKALDCEIGDLVQRPSKREHAPPSLATRNGKVKRRG